MDQTWGRTGQNDTDVNGDGVTDILDLVQVASFFSETMIPTAPIAFLSRENGKRGGLPQLNRDKIQDMARYGAHGR